MKDLLTYIHIQLSRILTLHKSSEKLSDEDIELLKFISGTVMFLENYAEHSGNGKLYQIVEDMEYSIYHMRVPFKSESALIDVEINITNYN